jgi:NADH:ubiquinone oxidoreductase subunit 2 (subunit N)
VSLALWAYALSVLHQQSPNLAITNLQGMARTWPFATAGVVLAALSLAGLPLLAAFPGHQAIWMGAARQSLTISLWILIGSLGMTIGVIRILTYLLTTNQVSSWITHETWPQRIFLSLGWLILFLFGLFPQWASFLWSHLPSITEHLGH